MKLLETLFLVGFLIMLITFFGTAKTELANFFPKSISLGSSVEKALEGAKGEYAMVVKNLKTGQEYSLNENKEFDAASLYKLWVMAEAYDQIQNGKLKENEVLSGDIADINKKFGIASEEAELTQGSVSFTVSSALKQMITISHNYAALLLSEKVKLSSAGDFLDSNGFLESSLGTDGNSPKTTARDTALFFEKLYKGEIASKENTDKMLNLLKSQQLNNKLPKYLPKGTVVAHKTGEFDFFSHDAGIVYSKKSDYIIVVLSKTDYPPGAEERIAKISQAVYDYFQNKNFTIAF